MSSLLYLSRLVQQAVQKSDYICLEKPIDMDELVELLERLKGQGTKGVLEKPRYRSLRSY